jgi:polyisoprenoid-binding protein YceI
VTGDLTIHGVTRTVSFVATMNEDKPNLFGHAALAFKQSDFGITPYSAAWGTVRNVDEVVLYLEILLEPRQEILASR